MAFKIFADANVLLDLALQRERFESAKSLFEYSREGIGQLVTTTSVIHIAAYIIRKVYGIDKTKEIMLAILKHVEIIDCDHDTVVMAINSKCTDIEDALQYYTAFKHNCGYFISSDKKLKKSAIPQLPVYTLIEFLKEIA